MVAGTLIRGKLRDVVAGEETGHTLQFTLPPGGVLLGDDGDHLVLVKAQLVRILRHVRIHGDYSIWYKN